MNQDNRKTIVVDIEAETKANTDYRRVRFTAQHTQLVYMRLLPGVEIGEEIHGVDQFIRLESGTAKAFIGKDKVEYTLHSGSAILIPAGTYHNIVNTSQEPVTLYTIYAGPKHLRDTRQPAKADEVDDEFNGITDL